MSNKSPLSNNDLGFFAELWQQAKLVGQLMLDRNVPIYLKLLPVAAIAYIISPFDFIPDVIPGLGQLDDLGILLIGAKIFIEMAPSDIVAQYLGRLKDPGAVSGAGDVAGKEQEA
ncbi:MAG: YkvA family protein, partial [Candidatus Promineifilaceae bacterium]